MQVEIPFDFSQQEMGISIENPITSAPNLINHVVSQEPLNPVCPVINTFLPLYALKNIFYKI